MGVVNVREVSKIYKLYNNPKERFLEAVNPFHREYGTSFYALKSVSFDIKKGEKVGIIGTNGSGKSTILKIITGVIQASEGEVHVDGRVAALLELGAGFDMEYTGVENIYMNGAVLGFSKEDMDLKIEKILEFADIGEFAYQPVKTYSSGMFVRLAFAAQIFSDPDILIVDEALSVGDIRFQQKCYRAMDTLMEGKTVILVTHDTAAVTRFCKRVVWLNRGELAFDGDVDEGLKRYKEFIINQAIDDKQESSDYSAQAKNEGIRIDTTKEIGYVIPPLSPDVKLEGSGDAIIYECAILNNSDEVIDIIEPGAEISCIFHVEFKRQIERPLVGLTIRDRLGNEIVGVNSETLKINLEKGEGRKEYAISFTVPPLNKGEYTITLAVASGYQEDHIQLCWADDALVFHVPARDYDIPGFLYLENGKIKENRI